MLTTRGLSIHHRPANLLFATYSIVARDEATGWLGVAVQTHQMAVGAIVPWLEPGIGALATQSLTNPDFGPIGLAMLRQGVPAAKVIEALIAADDRPEVRQVAVVDAQGQAGAWTGPGCIPEAGHHIGRGYSVQANMMTRDTVVAAMVEAYEGAAGDLAERMMAALQAAQTEAGDIRGKQSAALKAVKGDIATGKGFDAWRPLYDLRVDESQEPLVELGRLVRLRGAQLIDNQGYEALEKGEQSRALALWQQARDIAPELEELGFWQAITLADEHDDVATAAAILRPVLTEDPLRDNWLDLIRRLQLCGLIKRPGAADELIANLQGNGQR